MPVTWGLARLAAADEGTDNWPLVGLLDLCLIFSTSKISEDDMLFVVFLSNISYHQKNMLCMLIAIKNTEVVNYLLKCYPE